MKAVLTAIGTPGDVFPLIGLGRALKSRDHDVTLLTHPQFAAHARRVGLDAVPIGSEQEYRACLGGNPRFWDPVNGYREVVACSASLVPEMHRALERSIEPESTVVIAHYLDFASSLVARDQLCPVVTVVVPPMGLRFGDTWLAEAALPPPLDRLRAEIGRGWNFSPLLTVGLFPSWFAPVEPDWPVSLQLTGFHLFEGNDSVPEEVEAFLAAGTPPLVFTPGPRIELSLSPEPRRAFLEMVVETCAALGRRGLVLGRFEPHLYELPPHVQTAPFAPLSRLLPRCAGLVHHGGIGTIAAAIASGVPQIAAPLCHDQPDNAVRMAQLGVGDWIEPRLLTARALTDKLRHLLASAPVHRRCREFAERCRRIDAIGTTCELIEAASAATDWGARIPAVVGDVVGESGCT